VAGGPDSSGGKHLKWFDKTEPGRVKSDQGDAYHVVQSGVNLALQPGTGLPGRHPVSGIRCAVSAPTHLASGDSFRQAKIGNSL
jgi:hypothetical protein